MKRIICFLVIFQLVFQPFAFARITPLDKTKRIVIKPGDTLWALARIYLKDPLKWEEFKKYNRFTNPDLIYPNEELAIGYEDSKELLEALKEKSETIKMSIKEKDEYIEKMIKELKTPLPYETTQLIVIMKEKIEDLEGILEKMRDEKGSLQKVLNEKEDELLNALHIKDELIKKEQSLNAAISELNGLIDEKDRELKEEALEIERLKIENKRLRNEKNQIKTFSYFLTAGAFIGLILAKASSE